MIWLKGTVHAQDQTGTQAQRSHNRVQRAIPSFFASPLPVNDASDSIQSKVQRGLDAAPVPLNLNGKDIGLVGLGSYIVNLQAACNACHSAALSTKYATSGNPYFGQPTKINPAVYLGGGRDFGVLTPMTPSTAHIISRNLTPDKTGMPVGGLTFDDFLQIIRTGVDMDNLHPNCPGDPNENCVLRPFDGSLLQVMPWPEFQGMTDRELRAIYEYLSTIPCIAGPPAPSVLHNDCS